MNVYLISYDLKQPGQNYSQLYEELKKAASWWHYLESTWIISSSESLETWRVRIQSQVDQNDFFIIFELNPRMNRNGWLPQKAWEWLRTHLDQ